MSETRYFIRTQGRVTGPFTVSQIRALHQRGQFGRFHEVSVDQRSWQAASEVTDLFPVAIIPFAPEPRKPIPAKEDETPRSPRSPNSAPPPVETPQPDVEPPPPPASEPPGVPAHWQTADWYFQGPDGEPKGPSSLAQLHDLRRQGAVTDATLVCKPGMDSWTALADALRGESTRTATVQSGSSRDSPAARKREEIGFLLANSAALASLASLLPLFLGLLLPGHGVLRMVVLGLYAVLLFAALAGDIAAYVCCVLGPAGGSGRQMAASALILAGCELILRAGLIGIMGFGAAMAAFGPGGSTARLMGGALASAASWGRTVLFELFLCQAAQRRGQPLIVRSLLQSLPILGGVVILGLLFLLAALIGTAADLMASDRTALEIAWQMGLAVVGGAWAWWYAIYLVALVRLRA